MPAIEAGSHRPEDRGEQQQSVPCENATVAPIDKAGVHEEDQAGKADRRPDERAPAEWLRPQEQPNRDRPEWHRMGEHDRPSGRNNRQADDAADQKPGDLELSDPEQARSLPANRQWRLSRYDQRGRDQGYSGDQPEKNENQRWRLVEREFHQRPIPGPEMIIAAR